jgi:putative tricarboxylic transport membrane protein
VHTHPETVTAEERRDRVAGIIVCALGAAVAAYAQTFPPMPGQRVGPGFFPTAVGLLLAGLGAALLVAPSRPEAAAGTTPPPPPSRGSLGFIAVAGMLVFYTLAADRLGFFITGTIFLGTLLLVFGVRPRWVLPVALGVTLAMHYGFYTLLRVPLPWGILDAIAW